MRATHVLPNPLGGAELRSGLRGAKVGGEAAVVTESALPPAPRSGAKDVRGDARRGRRHAQARRRRAEHVGGGRFLVLLVFLLFARDAAAQNATPDVTTAVANVQAFYNRASTFSADFTQQYLAKAYNQTKTSTGHVILSKPGKMDWEYTDPKDNRVVSDGTTLRVYEAANKQMYEQSVNQSQYPAALSFLTGQGNLTASFTFQVMPGAQMAYPGGYVLVGTPITPTPAYTKVLFYVDSGTSQVLRVLILDGQQNRNRFDFANAQVNVTVDASKFTFTPPAGTTIVKP